MRRRRRGVDAPPAEKRPTLTLDKAPPGSPAPPPLDKPGEQPAAKAGEDPPPPASWKGAAKINWNRIHPAVKAQILERETALEADRAEITPLREMLDANRQMLVNESGSVAEGVRQLLGFARMSLDNPAGLIQHIARQRGINLAALGGQPGAPQQQPGTPQAPGLDHQYSAQQQRIEALEQRIASQSSAALRSQIEAFASNPAHPFFEDVRAEMGAYFDAGTVKTLEEAYDKAIWSNPAIRGQLMAQEAEKAQAERAAGVAKAKAANAASLTGSPVHGAQPNGAANQTDSIRATLESAYNDFRGSV